MNKKLLLSATLLIVNMACLQAQSIASRWYTPDHYKLQFAGSMGLFSVGAGYEIQKKKSDLDVYVGYLPDKLSPDDLFIITLKYTHNVVNIKLNNDWQLHPLTAGAYLTYTFGTEFSTDLPEWYPNGYYWWSEAVRPNIFIGGGISRNGGTGKSAVRFYYEIATNELKLVSLVQNSSLTIGDILHVGVGVKVNFASY